ncbi:MAG: YidC/Oxa1 family insertase periplasmic-domain containing protein [Planctomycetes bacterium]|nr:YidC/Oxa1 family insertase periplasmic-domain containing protein [Planctomycetota bacterium]
MKIKTAGIAVLLVFCLLCGGLVVDAVLDHPQRAKQLIGRVVPLAAEVDETKATTEVPTEEPIETVAEVITAAPVVYPQLSATNTNEQIITLGAVCDEIERFDDDSKYKFQVELTSKGAAVKTLMLNEFKDRNTEAPAPLALLAPLGSDQNIYSLANTALKVAPADAEAFDSRAFPLNKLNWKLVETDTPDEVRFEAELFDSTPAINTDKPGMAAVPMMLKIVKTYSVQPGSYDLSCNIAVENLSTEPIKVLMQMQGPGGMTREGVRQDARKIKAAYKSGETGVAVEALDVAAMQKKLKKNDMDAFKIKGKNAENDLAWSALTNKYFAAIVRPIPIETQDAPWLKFEKAQYYPAPTQSDDDKDLQNGSFSMTSQPITLASAGQDNAQQSFSLQMYVGPKDKKVFKKNAIYHSLQYFKTIDFRGCCCPQNVIAPMAFGIMWLMNTMFTLMGPLGNYGVVIMVLVGLVRLAMHPITKKSQVSMMKMQKLAPKMKEIQAKYAGNKQEMNKQVMAMYRDHGASPISGMLPMMLQMPIWIALWTAVYTSIDLRGAGFLPVWITDLSMPDQLFAIPFAAKVQTLPYIGSFFPDYFNLLPILMGVVMYLQQKMMPSAQASASTNPQMAQQQKMMMIMMPLLFPIMLYSGPSGVNLYIMSSISAGVIEQKIIRKHLKEKDEQDSIGKVPVTSKTGGKLKKKKPKPMYKG